MEFGHKYISKKKWAVTETSTFDWTMLKNINFIEPFGLVFLAAVIHKQFELSESGKITFHPDIINYLERMNFLDYLSRTYGMNLEIIPQRPKLRPHPLPDRLLEFQKIEFTDRYNYDECIDHLAELCQERIGDAVSFEYINDVFAELLSNVVRHSEILHFFAVAQKYPQNKVLKISIGDIGIGIPRSIRRDNYQNLSDNDAIVVATLPEISTDGGGMGLTTLKYYLKDPSDYIFILSNNGCVKFIKNGIIHYSNFESNISGTFIEICFKMHSIYRQRNEDSDLLF